jgi:hypothetical protein
MTWLGKILCILVFIGAVVWVGFTVNAYVARTNWKAYAAEAKKGFQDAEAARLKDRRDLEAQRDAYARLYAAEKSRGDDLAKSVEEIKTSGRKDDATYKKLIEDYTKADVQSLILQANVGATLNELDNTRKRNAFLEDERVKLVLAKEAADRERLRAENEKKLAQSIADENIRKVETLTAQVNEMRATGGGGGAAAVLRSIDKPPAPLPENIRGTVLRNMGAGDDLVQISIGIDAGLEPGSRLDVYREAGGGQYLGTLVVTSTIQPKEAVARFVPARPVPVARLRPDELPRKGDIVGRLR